MFCFVEFRSDLGVGEGVGFDECSGALVGSGDGFVKVGGDDACVDVVDEGGGVGVVSRDVVGVGDEACLRKGGVHDGGGLVSRGYLRFGVDMPGLSGDDGEWSGAGVC